MRELSTSQPGVLQGHYQGGFGPVESVGGLAGVEERGDLEAGGLSEPEVGVEVELETTVDCSTVVGEGERVEGT